MHALVIVDTIFNEILKVDIKMAMSMELERTCNGFVLQMAHF